MASPATLLLGAVLLAGCGATQAGTRTGTHGLGPGGYLARESGWVDFIEFTMAGASLTGSLDEATLQGTTVGHQHYAFTGVVNGSSVTLTIPGGLGLQTSLSGEWHDSTITLSVPQQDGTLASVDFTTSNTNEYNGAVEALQAQAQAAQGQQAEASASAAAAAQQQQADNQIASLGQTMQSDIAQLQKISFDDELKSAQQGLTGQQSDLDGMHKDEQTAEAEPDPSARCGDASGVEADASGIGGDASGVEGDQSGLTGDISNVRNGDIAQAKSDLSKLQATLAQDSSYPGSVPSADDVNGAIGSVQKLIDQASSTMTGYVSQAKSTASSAQSEAQAFYAKYCSS